MNLDELVYSRLTGYTALTDLLTTYAGSPAVFSPEAPDDKQPGWDGGSNYPRIVFNHVMQADTERKRAGTLSVTLICKNSGDLPPETIEPLVIRCLTNILVKDSYLCLYAFSWAKTEAFTYSEGTNELLVGTDIRFDISEFPWQETTDPDPIVAMSRYCKGICPESTVVGIDHIGEITEPSAESPVIYCRLLSVDKSEETNNVAWMDGRMAVHVLCPESSTRMKMTAAIAYRMSLDGEITLLDKSPMFIQRLQANHKADYLKDGQITVTGHYGLLRYRRKGHTLKQIISSYS